VNRVQKVLEDADFKLASVAPDVMGVGGRAMLNENVGGQSDTDIVAELAKGRPCDRQALLLKALSGRVRAHHRFMLAQHLSHIDFLDDAIAQIFVRCAPDYRTTKRHKRKQRPRVFFCAFDLQALGPA
jgi:transposase